MTLISGYVKGNALSDINSEATIMASNSVFMKAEEVQKFLGVSRTAAYKNIFSILVLDKMGNMLPNI